MKRLMYVAAACFIASAFALASQTASARQAARLRAVFADRFGGAGK